MSKLTLANRMYALHLPEFEQEGLPMPGRAMNAIYPRFGKTYMDPEERERLEKEIIEGDYIDMGIGVYFRTHHSIIEAGKKSLDEGKTAYADITELRVAVSNKLWEENRIKADPITNIALLSGATTGIAVCALSLLEAGDHAVVLDPDYLRHGHCSVFAGASLTRAPMPKRDGAYYFDPEILAKAIRPNTKVLWVTNPTNPSGYLFSQEDCRAIADIAFKHNLWVVTNELYDALRYDGNPYCSLASIPGMEERTITIGGVSKNYDMTGFRLGWVAGPKMVIANITDLLFFGCQASPPTTGQWAALAALTQPLRTDYITEIMKTYHTSRNLICDALSSIPKVKCPRPMAGQFAFPDFSAVTQDDLSLAQYLKQEAHILTITGSIWGYNARGHLRIALANPLEIQKKGLARMEKALREYVKTH